MRNRTPVPEIYIPSPDVHLMAQRLLAEYPPAELSKRLRWLSRQMNGKGESYDSYAGEKDYRLKTENAEDFSYGTGLQTAAGDMLSLPELIKTLADGETLKRNKADNLSNPVLLSFFRNPLHPDLPTPISKCLEVTRQWCAEQMDALEARAERKQEKLHHSSAPDTPKLVEQLHYLDKTSGMLFKISQLTDAVTREINAGRQATHKQPGKGAA